MAGRAISHSPCKAEMGGGGCDEAVLSLDHDC